MKFRAIKSLSVAKIAFSRLILLLAAPLVRILLFFDSLVYLQIVLSKVDIQTSTKRTTKSCKKAPIEGNY